VASRFRPPARPFDPLAEFRLPKAANRILGTMVGLESVLIRAGISLPVGGSLLLVARRRAA
jgi:hypothetical protein